MAVLSKIRQRSLLLILVIGFCLLAFIVGDIFNSGGFNSQSKYVGSVNGKDINFETFRIKVSNIEKDGQGMSSTQASARVWDQEIALAILENQFDELGIQVGQSHIIEVLKSDPNIGQNPMFLNEAGKFDLSKFQEFFKANPAQAQALVERENDAELNAKFSMYNSMVRGGLFTTNNEAQLAYRMEMDKVSFDYVAVPFSSIKESEAKVSDDEIVAYMKKNEKDYKAEKSKEIEYVVIEEKPSVEDDAEIKSTLDKLMTSQVVYNNATKKNDTVAGFRSTTNIADFVNANSDVPFDSTFVAKKDLPAEVAEKLFSLGTGEFYGPYKRGNYYVISKMLGRQAGASAKASHILISYEGTQVPSKKEVRTKEEAKAKAEMLLAQVKANPASFTSVAMMNSDDSSANQGGDLGYFQPNQMVKPFNDYVFNNSIGSIGLVETDFGYHIIQVTDKEDAIKLATLALQIKPSEKTTDQIYTKAVQFEMDANDKDFATAAKNGGVTIMPSVTAGVMDENFGTLGAQRAIVRWAFEKGTKVGDVKRFEVANVGNVIARVKKANDAGLMAIAIARPLVEPILMNEKKAEIISKKLSGSTLEEMAKANTTTVQKAADLTLRNPMIPNAGPEPKVVGTAMGIGQGKMSKAIVGNSAVYVVKTTAVTKAEVLKDVAPYVQQIKAQKAGDANRVLPALKGKADIEDNRAEFQY